jgi:pilus assembly protein CpaC
MNMKLIKLNQSLKHLKETGVAYLTVCFVGMQLVAFPLAAQEVGSATKEVVTASGPSSGATSRDALSLAVGKSKAYKFKNPVVRISVGNPAVADVMLVNPREVYFLGKKSGSTNVTLWHTNNQTTNLDLFVGGDTDYIVDLISGLMPNAKNIKATAAGESIVLSGRVADAETVQKAMALTEHATGKKVLNMLSTNDLEQVLLEVKVAEIDRSIADALGIQAQGTNFSFNPLGAAALGFSATASAAVGAGSGFTQTWFQANMQLSLIHI